MNKVNLTLPLERFEDNKLMYYYHFKVSDEIVDQFTEGTDRRIICTFENGAKHYCAFMPSSQGWFILMGKDALKKTGAVLGLPMTFIIEKDRSKYGMPMPEELEAVMMEDEEGSKYFHQLTPGKQRNLIHLINKIKNVDIRVRKSMAIMEHLKEVEGALDFRGLNQMFKAYNQRYRLD